MVLNVKQTPSLPAPHKTNDFRAFYALNSDSRDSCRTRRDGQATRQMRLKGTSYKITAARWPRGRGGGEEEEEEPHLIYGSTFGHGSFGNNKF